MFKHIMVPVDLAQKDKWERGISVACDLARHYGAGMTLVSVTGGLQARVSHSSAEYGRQLEAFAAEIAARETVNVETWIYDVPDPSVEVDRILIKAAEETGSDLIVMATHQPGWMEYIVNSHGGRLASHASVSVMLVR